MTILITGASGFIGSHLVKRLTEDGEKVISLIHDCPVWTEWLEESVKPTIKVQGDIRDFQFLKRVINRYEISKVYHLAALSIVKQAYKNPVNIFDVNVMGTVKLLEACRQLEVEKTLVQVTDKVYGNQMDATIRSSLIPTEPYGTSKVCTDFITRTFARVYGMKIVISRMCNVYGLDYSNRIVPNTVKACFRGESPVIFKNGESKRQYIYVDDAVSALKFLMETGWTDGVFNIGTNDVLSQEEVVLKVLEYFPLLKPQYVEKPELKEIKSQSMLFVTWPPYWSPKVSFEEGVKLTINAFRKYGF